MPAVPELDPTDLAVPAAFDGTELAAWLGALPGAVHIGDAWRTDPLHVVASANVDGRDWRVDAVLDTWPHLSGGGSSAFVVVPRYLAEVLWFHVDADVTAVAHLASRHPHAVATVAAALSDGLDWDHDEALGRAEELIDDLASTLDPAAWARTFARTYSPDVGCDAAAELADRLTRRR